MKKIGVIVTGVLISGGLVLANQMGAKGLNFIAPGTHNKLEVVSPVEGEIIYEKPHSGDPGFWGRISSGWIPLGGAGSVMPIGSILTFAGPDCPAGYAMADGTAVSRGGDYAALFTVIGITHGQGDGTSTFNLPDYRGRFLRGVDHGAGRDPNVNDRTAMNGGGNVDDNVGSVQGHAFQTHNHTWSGVSVSGQTNIITGGNPTRALSLSGSVTVDNASSSGAEAQPSAGETRPLNAYVNFCIKL